MTTPAIPAASLIILRDRPDGPPHILMAERSTALAFVGGALVFPGGRVDPEDRAAAGGDDELAHRLCAVREAQEEVAITIDPTTLTPFSRWHPPVHVPRVFDARFYLAAAPADAEPVVDGGECVRAFWITAAEALAEADAGRAKIVTPTRLDLTRLATFASLAEARANALRHPPRLIIPTIVDDLEHIPAGAGYPVTAAPRDVF